ncbi:MAG: cobalamin-dependent protein, partial [Planctomycetaceae bacterium]
MPTIILSTLNARYSHASFGLRCLYANMQELQPQTVLLEFTTQDSTVDMLAELLSRDPAIIGFGVYIWNVEPLTRLVRDLRQVRPSVRIVLGGPEVSYETADQEIVRLADYVITG